MSPLLPPPPPLPPQADFAQGRLEALLRERDDAVLALRTTKQCLTSTTHSLDQLQAECVRVVWVGGTRPNPLQGLRLVP
jgi:hypothetical protein